MTESRCDTFLTTIVKGNHTTVRERQLQFALTLLACHLARHRTVNLVGQPVLTSHSFKLKHSSNLSAEVLLVVRNILVSTFHRLISHDSLRTMTKHLSHIEVERSLPIPLLEGEMGISCRLSDYIKRSALPFCNLADMLDVLLVDEESHAFLAFVGDDFLSRKCWVANRKFRHINESATLFYKLGEAVDVSCASMIMDADNGIHFLFAKRTHQIVGTLLHLWVSTLYCVKLDTTRIATSLHAGNAAATKSDAIVITAHDHNLIAFLRFFLQAIALRAITYASSQHDDFVVGILFLTFLMLESEDRSADKGLSELVSEVGSTIRSLDENLLRSLVEPLPDRQDLLPFALFLRSGIARHIHRSTCDGP